MLYRTAYSLLENQADAEDVPQSLFLRMLQSGMNARPPSKREGLSLPRSREPITEHDSRADLVAVFTYSDSGLRVRHDFTGDREALLEVFERVFDEDAFEVFYSSPI